MKGRFSGRETKRVFCELLWRCFIRSWFCYAIFFSVCVFKVWADLIECRRAHRSYLSFPSTSLSRIMVGSVGNLGFQTFEPFFLIPTSVRQHFSWASLAVLHLQNHGNIRIMCFDFVSERLWEARGSSRLWKRAQSLHLLLGSAMQRLKRKWTRMSNLR